MPKKIAQTYQHRLFNDEELKLPDYDKIVRWADLAIRENIGFFLDRIGYKTVRNERGETCLWAEKTTRTITWENFDYHESKSTAVARNLIKKLSSPKYSATPGPSSG